MWGVRSSYWILIPWWNSTMLIQEFLILATLGPADDTLKQLNNLFKISKHIKESSIFPNLSPHQDNQVQTDYHSLKYLLEQRVTTHEQQRLLIKLLPFDFSIEYGAGKENKGADALSRKPQHADFLSLAIPFPLDFVTLQNDLSKDDFTAHIIRELQQNPTAFPEFQLVRARGISDSAMPPPLPISESWELLLEPVKILKHHWAKESSVKVELTSRFSKGTEVIDP
ncbi:transposon Ty3-G Gag-Pol polyprotein [Senna tora]|uniref:Transposon Ty3-G Gag-Pol polyprotein n=1 Tax=Senna tora TaxID=362788 RepID=A0A834W6V0_9FABA|nr:transposon Ty3-G Gag-Pol polyprotein [Senna tora]